MDEEEISVGLRDSDEYLHIPTDEVKWRESYYFNWVDLKNKISGFSTIGIVPNEEKREFVFFLFLPDRNEIYYKEPSLEKYDKNVNTMLREKRLKYIMIEPFKKWQIRYMSRKLTFNLVFETRFPVYDFGIDTSASWHQHFEASGRILGTISFKDGEKIEIKGCGQRDKSWGYRDWHQFDKWYAGHFQFKTWSCTFRKDIIKNSFDLSGHISNNSGNIALKKVTIETIQSKDQFKSPISAIYTITDINENHYTIKAQRIKDDSFTRFVREFEGGFTELFEQMAIMEDLNTGEIGSGMMEHLRTIKIK
ncbi:MAG: hypothetical protein P8Y23_11735 [Candidatus Lokiarchaeota archaeon]|jgi:hypothetical protein